MCENAGNKRRYFVRERGGGRMCGVGCIISDHSRWNVGRDRAYPVLARPRPRYSKGMASYPLQEYMGIVPDRSRWWGYCIRPIVVGCADRAGPVPTGTGTGTYGYDRCGRMGTVPGDSGWGGGHIKKPFHMTPYYTPLPGTAPFHSPPMTILRVDRNPPLSRV